MTDTALEAVLRRDRLVVTGALAVLATLAWSYVLWLAADMDMGGMDMTGFRMIPAGTGLMAPANAAWKPIEFTYVFAMWAVTMIGMMAPSALPMILMYACVGRQASAAGKPFAPTSWFAGGYFLAWSGFALAATFAQWALERTTRRRYGKRQQGAWRYRANRSRHLSMDSPQGRLFGPVPVAAPVPSSPWRFSWRARGLPAAGPRARTLLHRLLLDAHGAVVYRRSDERSLDRTPLGARTGGESYSGRSLDRTHRRRRFCRSGRLYVDGAIPVRLAIQLMDRSLVRDVRSGVKQTS